MADIIAERALNKEWGGEAYWTAISGISGSLENIYFPFRPFWAFNTAGNGNYLFSCRRFKTREFLKRQ